MRLIVRQQGRSQIGIVPIVRDSVLGVQQLLGLVGADERGWATIQDGTGHAGGGGDLLESGGQDEGWASKTATTEGEGLGLDCRLDRCVGCNL